MSTRGPAGSPAKRPAKRPEPRYVNVKLNGNFTGWEMTARADFPARVLIDLQSNDVEKVMAGLDSIVTDHNFPDEDDELATSMAEVAPYEGLVKAVQGLTEQLGKLPNR